MKTCKKCTIEKPIECFSVNNTLKDKRHIYCKECEVKRVKKYYEQNSEKVRLRQSEYYRINVVKFREYNKKRYSQIKLNPEKYEIFNRVRSIASNKSRLKYPEKAKARTRVMHALNSGELVKPDKCSVCLKNCSPQAHHDSYDESQWLNVRWLCRSCHTAHHRKYPETKNIQKA